MTAGGGRRGEHRLERLRRTGLDGRERPEADDLDVARVIPRDEHHPARTGRDRTAVPDGSANGDGAAGADRRR